MFQCVLEAVEESLGEDRTEKHFLAFLHAVFEQVTTRSRHCMVFKPLFSSSRSDFLIHQDLDKEVFAGMSDRLISTVDSLLENHVLHYSCIDSGEQQ